MIGGFQEDDMGQLFAIVLAGCTHDAAICEIVDRIEVRGRNAAACEEILMKRMENTTADFPVIQGYCAPMEIAGLA